MARPSQPISYRPSFPRLRRSVRIIIIVGFTLASGLAAFAWVVISAAGD
jgi:hypothetical protein